MNFNLTLDLVNLMWTEKRTAIDVKRRAEPCDDATYFQSLSVAVAEIVAYLRKNNLTGRQIVLVKHGTGAKEVFIDLEDLRVIPDPHDPSRPVLHYPATPKE